MKRKSTFWLILLLTGLCTGWQIDLNAQLINIESKRIHADSVMFSIQNDFSFVLTSNNGDYIYRFIDNLTAQLKTPNLKHNFFIVGDYNLFRSREKDYSNIFMFHLRHIYSLYDRLRLESLVQVQEDQLLAINSRYLAGVGIRLRIVNTAKFHFNIGTTYMYEREESTAFDQLNYFHRNSSYCALGFDFPSKNVSLSNTFYIQPLFSDFSDYRLLEEFKFSIELFKGISFNNSFIYYVDKVTPSGKSQSRINTMMGIGISI